MLRVSSATSWQNGWQPRARGDLTPIDLTQTADTLWERARRSIPRSLPRRSVSKTEAVVSQAGRERAPEVSVQIGLMATRRGQPVRFHRSIDAPADPQPPARPNRPRSCGLTNVARREQRAIFAETEAALQRSIAVSRSRHAAAARLAQEVFAHLPELRRMAEESYRQGKSSIVDLLDAFRSLKSLRMQYVDQIVGAEHAEVELLYAAGLSTQSLQGRIA